MMNSRTPLLLLLLATAASAQTLSPWQGEWGAFSGDRAQVGRRVSIHDCTATACRFVIDSRSSGGSSSTASEQSLTFQSPTTASATLAGEPGKPPCILAFRRQPSPTPGITVTASGQTCSAYYSAGTATMSGSYPLRSTTVYAGTHAEECFLDNSPARLATCTRPEIAALEQKWQGLASDYPPQPPNSKGRNTDQYGQQRDEAILHACDAATSPAECLTTRYTAEIATMQTTKDAYLQGTTARGDPAEGGRLAEKIAGSYRHSFPNADAQGHKFTSTDTLTLRPVGPASIHFDAALNFANGHTCSLSGGALYRKDGSFVFDDLSANNPSPDTSACRLAIIPTSVGLEFKDVTGGCRSYCGARGTWDGESFTFKDRVGPSTGGKPPSPAKP